MRASPRSSTVHLQNLVQPSFLCARHGPGSCKWLRLPRETKLNERFLFYSLGEVNVRENSASKKGAAAHCPGPHTRSS